MGAAVKGALARGLSAGNKRLRIPDAKPQQVFAWANNGDGSFTLTVVKAERKEAFPRGSLLKYLTPARDKEQLGILELICFRLNEPKNSSWNHGFRG